LGTRSGYILALEMNHREKLHCKRDREIGSIWERSNSAAESRRVRSVQWRPGAPGAREAEDKITRQDALVEYPDANFFLLMVYRGFVEQEKILPQQCPASPTLLAYYMQSNPTTDKKENQTKIKATCAVVVFFFFFKELLIVFTKSMPSGRSRFNLAHSKLTVPLLVLLPRTLQRTGNYKRTPERTTVNAANG